MKAAMGRRSSILLPPVLPGMLAAAALSHLLITPAAAKERTRQAQAQSLEPDPESASHRSLDWPLHGPAASRARRPALVRHQRAPAVGPAAALLDMLGGRQAKDDERTDEPSSQEGDGQHADDKKPGDKKGGKDDKPKKPQPWYMTLNFQVKVLMVVAFIEVVAAIAFELVHSRWINVDPDLTLPTVSSRHRTPLWKMFAGIPLLVFPYFRSPEGAKGRACTAVILFLGVLQLFIGFVHNIWQKEWWDLFNKRNAADFPRLMGIFVVIVTGWITCSVYREYISQWLYIDWREFMTKRLTQNWLRDHTHYVIQLGGAKRMDNPDQRIQEDIHIFVESAIGIVPEFLMSIGNLFIFVPLLLSLEPKQFFGRPAFHGWLLCFAAVYSLLGSLATHLIGASMINFTFTRQRYEADFRQMALHVRDRAESVALYSSENFEEEHLRQQFERIKVVQWRQMLLTKRLSFFTSTFNFVQFLVPFFILAPDYFMKGPDALSLGDLFQLNSAVGNVASSLDWFLKVYVPLTNWRATSDRLITFETAITGAHKSAEQAAAGLLRSTSASFAAVSSASSGVGGALVGGQPAAAADQGAPETSTDAAGPDAAATPWLQATIAEVQLPTGEPIWKDVKLELRRGQSALFTGPEGVGKSMLFKALAGIWPHIEGRSVLMPAGEDREVLFVPQRPALPKRSSLAEAFAYPDLRSAYTDEEILRAVLDVQLEKLMIEPLDDCDSSDAGGEGGGKSPTTAREASPIAAADRAGGADAASATAGLDRVENWGERLSPGQQQRLALGHVLLQRPRILFLDEATSNVGKGSAVDLYRMLAERLPEDRTIITISHDLENLAPLHDVHFAVVAEGNGRELRVVKGAPGAAASGRSM